MALTMWFLGAIVAATGAAVYLEYGTVSVLSSLGVSISKWSDRHYPETEERRTTWNTSTDIPGLW